MASFFKTLPIETTLLSITNAGVDITPYCAICVKSVTCSIVVSIPSSSSASFAAASSALHFAQPEPSTFTAAPLDAAALIVGVTYYGGLGG